MARAERHLARPLREILAQLGLPPATYYRWQERVRQDRLSDRAARRPRGPRPTPAEVAAVCGFALDHTVMGYKRLCWLMVDRDVAALRPYQVYEILRAADLLARRARVAGEPLRRPPEPTHPDEVWHVDLMYLLVGRRWYYLVDILDGYSRALVHWSLNLTMTADTVILTVQEALDRLPLRTPGRPRIVHDRGGQFIGADWRHFVRAVDVTDIKTRVRHPESNGRLERLHRTHREEGLAEDVLSDYYSALDAMARWADYYNHERPHSALGYLCPWDYYRGSPETRLAERERKLRDAAQARTAYWKLKSDVSNTGREPQPSLD